MRRLDAPQLYGKPDDRWEVNDVADRCPEIVEQLQSAANDFRACLESGRPDDAITALAAIPDDGQPAREVDPREVLRVRMAALDQMGWHDEALACCLILVTRWNDMSHVIDLLHRVAGQDADAVAAVIGGVQARPALVEELRRSGAFGADVAARL